MPVEWFFICVVSKTGGDWMIWGIEINTNKPENGD
jgi:hypothetical protein